MKLLRLHTRKKVKIVSKTLLIKYLQSCKVSQIPLFVSLSASRSEFTKDVADVSLQVQAASAAVDLESSYTQANLFYEQSLYSYNVSNDAAKEVQLGPYYCFTDETIGYCSEHPDDSLPDPSSCCNYQQLVHLCQRQLKWEAAIKIIGATMSLAAACVDPIVGFVDADSATKYAASVGKTFKAVDTLANTGLTMEQAFTPIVGK